MTAYRTIPAGPLKGSIQVAPDKSISHRALLFSALAMGTSRIRNLLLGEDVLRTLTIIRELGVATSHDAATLKKGDELLVTGVGLGGLKLPSGILYCGNSGTTMRLLLGLLSGAKIAATMTGDASLNKRPMGRVMEPLMKMGARFDTRESDGKRYIVTLANEGLSGIAYDSPVASAQIKTAVLLAGLHANGATSVTEPEVSRDHTELMLKAMGGSLEVSGKRVTLTPPRALKSVNLSVPGDISSAAFFIVGALITPGSDVLIRHVNLNPTRTGILDVLSDMGGNISILNRKEEGGEPVGDLHVKYSELRNVRVGGPVIPRLIDEIPVLALAATQAKGDMVLSDAQELRVKESDRIRAICRELSGLGADVVEKGDGFTVSGGHALVPRVAEFHSSDDHRIAMMLAIAGCVLNSAITIDDVDCVRTSFPDFFELLEGLKA